MHDNERFLQEWQEILLSPDDAAFPEFYEEFTARLALLPDAYFDRMPKKTIAKWTASFLAAHQRYSTLHERQTARDLQVAGDAGNIAPDRLLHQLYGEEARVRLTELEKIAEEITCRKIVMVGAGPFPVTLLWLSRAFPKAVCVGLEVNAKSLELAQATARRLGRKGVRLSSVDGRDYDYAGTDFVYIANEVMDKRQVLERIQATAGHPVSIIVRDPYRHGWLLAEQVAEKLPASFALRQTGAESLSHQSHDLVLGLLFPQS